MSERSCPMSGSIRGRCPAGAAGMGSKRGSSQRGPRGCSFSGYAQPGDVRGAFNIPTGMETEDWLRLRERKSINEILYSDVPTTKVLNATKNIDTLTVNEQDLLAVALGAPARQIILRAQEIGPKTGWRDGFLTAEYGFVPPDMDELVAALHNSPGRVWSDLMERMPGVVSRGRVREAIAALPLVEGTPDIIPDDALWPALVVLGLLCSIYRYEDKHDGHEGVSINAKAKASSAHHGGMGVGMGMHNDDVLEEVKGLPKSVGVPYCQISKRMGRPIPHLTFVDQSSYNTRVKDAKSKHPYVERFDNIDLRWPIFGDAAEIAFLKGCADTSASFQHGPDAIANCQEAVMNRDVEGLLREMIRLKEILERMPNAFHTISPNPSSGANYVSADEWVRWAKFSAPLSNRCPASSGLQFPPYLLMDAFLGRKKYDSFLGAEGLHLRAWAPSNLRAFMAAVEGYYSVPEFVAQSGDPRLMGVLDGIVEAYCGERGFMGVHRYKVFGILEVAAKTGRTETNGNSGQSGLNARPWEETHQQFSDAMKERLEPYRGNIPVEPHQMRGTFEECRYRSRILSRSHVDGDAKRGIAMVTLDLQDTGVTFQPGDRLAIMPLNGWGECAKVALALGLEDMLDVPVALEKRWARFAEHVASVTKKGEAPRLLVRDIIRRGHLAPLTQELVLKVHNMLRASSNIVLQVLATDEWPVRGSLGDLLQSAVVDTPTSVWDQAFDLEGDLSWLSQLVEVEVPRTYSISCSPDELLPSTVDLTVSRAEYDACAVLAGNNTPTVRAGVSSSFLNPPISLGEDGMAIDEEILIGVSRPVAFQLPLDGAAPCAFFAGGSGIAPFRSFWQARIGRTVGRNILYLGVQSREKFCYEDELREYVNAGQMEVHTAFSRDARGLVYDRASRDLIEKNIAPRYIDTLIVEQGETICDLVMSKSQGGLGGFLYVCGSVSVFDSVMSGIKRALYNYRTSTMDSSETILNTAFAERRFMLDVFMTPRPLPCNLPTIAQSQLALHTGHRPGERMWIAVHGKVYDVTDFCPMHPGGTLIIKSNAGVDCSRSFDNLAHTNNPEVASLLTKYFIGHLTPKPDYHGVDEMGELYDLWLDYLRTVTETLVAQQFETTRFMGAEMGSSTAPNWWYQGNMLSIKGVRSFYQYQSRLLQRCFSAMFGPKFQELVLKLSFSLANAAPPGGAGTRLPDVLGVVARAKSSEDAIETSKQVALIGEFVGDSESARFHERGIIAYAVKSVELDMSLLEDIRQEACAGMDAFDSLSSIDVLASGSETAVIALATFLMQLLERMAKRLEIFYSKLAMHSIYQPEIEHNPARTRWHILRKRIRDGSFFILAQNAVMGSAPSYVPQRNQHTVDFDRVMSQISQTLVDNNNPQSSSSRPAGQSPATTNLTTMNAVRTQEPRNGTSAFESHVNQNALRNMSSFVNKNMRAIRRLSKLPTMGAGFDAVGVRYPGMGAYSTPPSSRGSSRSPTRMQLSEGLHIMNQAYGQSPPLGVDHESMMATHGFNRRFDGSMMAVAHHPPTPPLSGPETINSMMGKLNVRAKPNSSRSSTPVNLGMGVQAVNPMQPRHVSTPPQPLASGPSRSRSSTTSSLRAFKLGQRVSQGQAEVKIAPTF